MPYLIETTRDRIHDHLCEEGTNWYPENAAELNFVTSGFIANFLEHQGVNYANINEMIGALECAKLELYRVLASPYEDMKAEQNGGLYEELLEQ